MQASSGRGDKQQQGLDPPNQMQHLKPISVWLSFPSLPSIRLSGFAWFFRAIDIRRIGEVCLRRLTLRGLFFVAGGSPRELRHRGKESYRELNACVVKEEKILKCW